ncbi:MAG: cupin domain-containing protein [Hyphomonadaceae bacterium]|nr:cupin domain-containing protein [Hyphomonadaceae bacterium]
MGGLGWRGAVAAGLVALAAMGAARAQPAKAWTPETIPWAEVNADGTRFALLEGVRDVAGAPFSYAFFIPAGVWDGPHAHTADARVFVARGTLHLGYGDRPDRSMAKAYPAGSFLIVPAGATHFDGADEDTLILGVAVGPWGTRYVDERATPSAGAPPR